MTNRIEAQCRANGMRLTGQRKLIAQVLSEASDHPDVRELHRRVAEQHDHILKGAKSKSGAFDR